MTRGEVVGFLVIDASALEQGGVRYAECANGTMGCALWDGVVDIDRYDAAYRVRDLGVNRVRLRSQELGFVVDGDYVVSDGVTDVGGDPAPAPALHVDAYPNPFNPETTIRIRGRRIRAQVEVFDVAGQLVRRLWNGVVDGDRLVRWDGRNDGGTRVASGTYLVRVRSTRGIDAVKVILLK